MHRLSWYKVPDDLYAEVTKVKVQKSCSTSEALEYLVRKSLGTTDEDPADGPRIKLSFYE